MTASEPVVLIAEDDPHTREVLCELVTMEGWQAVPAPDGPIAVAYIETRDLDLVLLDLMLPLMDGLEICRRARARQADVYLPIIMLTALNSPEQQRAGFAAGADDYVTKPFDVRALLDRARVWMRARQRLARAHRAVLEHQEALRLAQYQRMAAQVEAVELAARELGHLVNNDLTPAVGFLDLLVADPELELPLRLQRLCADAVAGLSAASQRLEQLRKIQRIETHSTPFGPALDLARSAQC
jgi:DNA-binding response OmpR family regulator